MCVALVPVGPQVNLRLLTFPDIDTDMKVGGASRASVLETTERLDESYTLDLELLWTKRWGAGNRKSHFVVARRMV